MLNVGLAHYLRPVGDRIYKILLVADFEIAELQGGCLALLWGIWLMLMSTKPPSPAGVLIVMAPILVWGVLFMILGVVQIGALVAQSWRLRRASSLAAVILWLFVAMLLDLNDWRLLAVPITFAFACGSAWGYMRMGARREVYSGPLSMAPIVALAKRPPGGASSAWGSKVPDPYTRVR